MLWAILNKSWRPHPSRNQLYGHLPPITKKLYKLEEPDTQDNAGEARTSSFVMYSYGPPHMANQMQDDQLEHSYSSYVMIWNVILKTCRRRWMTGRRGEREGQGYPCWPHDMMMMIYICVCVCVCVCVSNLWK